MTNLLIEDLEAAAHTEIFHGSGAQRSIALDKAIAIVRQHQAEAIKHATGELIISGVTMLIDKPGLYELKASFVAESSETWAVPENPTLVATGNRLPEPVLLEKCARAIVESEKTAYPMLQFKAEVYAKAVLEAAKVPYVE